MLADAASFAVIDQLRRSQMQRLFDRLRPYRYTAVAIVVLSVTLSICGH
jgi:hypothetical protein